MPFLPAFLSINTFSWNVFLSPVGLLATKLLCMPQNAVWISLLPPPSVNYSVLLGTSMVEHPTEKQQSELPSREPHYESGAVFSTWDIRARLQINESIFHLPVSMCSPRCPSSAGTEPNSTWQSRCSSHDGGTEIHVPISAACISQEKEAMWLWERSQKTLRHDRERTKQGRAKPSDWQPPPFSPNFPRSPPPEQRWGLVSQLGT